MVATRALKIFPIVLFISTIFTNVASMEMSDFTQWNSGRICEDDHKDNYNLEIICKTVTKNKEAVGICMKVTVSWTDWAGYFSNATDEVIIAVCKVREITERCVMAAQRDNQIIVFNYRYNITPMSCVYSAEVANPTKYKGGEDDEEDEDEI